METPNIPTLMQAVKVSKSYAAVIRKGEQSIPLNLAAAIYCKTGWRHRVISQLSDATVLEIAQKQPWSPPPPRVKAA
jgi:hypothetical protein